MREIKLPFGRRVADGVIVSIQSALRGLACDCTCPKCSKPLVACKGEVVRPYFRHHAELAECFEARETALHMFAKQLIVDQRRLALPYSMGEVCNARAEVALPIGVRPDVLLDFVSGETLAVEIWVCHQVEADKVEIYANHDQAALEIDLRPYRFVDDADWPHIILDAAERSWIYPPLAVRVERERARQEIIDGMRLKRAEALEAMRLAEAARNQEQVKLRGMKLAAEIRQQSEAIEHALAIERLKLKEAEYHQELVKEAEARAATAEHRAAVIARRERERKPSDLQALVAAFGNYSAITPEAWEQHDTDTKLHRERVRSGYFYSRAEIGNEIRTEVVR
jgi:hypothetical protein